MKFVEVKELPKLRDKKDLKGYIEEFINMNVKIVRVEFNEHEYVKYSSAYSALHKCIKAQGYPVIVRMINKEVYLIRKDM